MYRELERYHQSLAEYIEATYHISHPTLVELRRALLQRPTVIAQRPYLESTPRYRADRRFADLNIPAPVAALLTALAAAGAAFDPPYDHQAQALEHTLTDGADLLVTTGTGSGKTETFLLPLLGHLYQEACARPRDFQRRGLRALILYPMNALVNDQLNRLRLLFGHDVVTRAFRERGGRPPKFARYTGRTLFPGARPQAGDPRAADTLRTKLKPLEFYLELLKAAQDSADPARAAQTQALIAQLKRSGRWPAKRDLAAWYWGPSRRWFGPDGAPARVVEDEQGDAELLIRQEVQARSPDILMTNYSMLEYMLLRPLERSIWREAEARFAACPDDRLLLVLDEAHLYRGATGAEVALLLRRLRQRLGLSADRVQVICTSASFEDRDRAMRFISALSGKPTEGFLPLIGARQPRAPSGPGQDAEAEALAQVDLGALASEDQPRRAAAIAPLLHLRADALAPAALTLSAPLTAPLQVRALDARGEVKTVLVPAGQTRLPGDWIATVDASPAPATAVEIGLEGGALSLALGPSGLTWREDPLKRPLYALLHPLPVAGRLVNITSSTRSLDDSATDVGGAQEIGALADRLFPDVDDPARRRAATDALIELCCLARGDDDRPLLAARAHAFFRGLPGLWACLDPDCSALPEGSRRGPTGAIFPQPRDRCLCGARALELHTCRGCGLSFAHGYAEDPGQPDLLWSERGEQVDEEAPQVSPVHLMLEEGVGGGRAAWLDALTGRIGAAAGRPREVWLAPPGQRDSEGGLLPPDRAGLFQNCPRCQEKGAKISGHMTSGDQPFQELVSTQLLTQPPRAESQTPLKGRKVMIFSDGRQKASRLSGNLKAFSLRDAARPLLLIGFQALRDRLQVTPTLEHAYLALLIGCALRRVSLPVAPAKRGRLDEHRELVDDLLAHDGDLAAAARELSGQIQDEAPEDVLQEIHGVLFHAFTGVEALALGSFSAEPSSLGGAALSRLPAPSLAGAAPAAARQALLDRWAQLAARARMIVLRATPPERIAGGQRGRLVNRGTGSFTKPLKADLGGSFHRAQLGKTGQWLSWLQRHMAGAGGATAEGIVVDPARVRLRLWDELSFARCERCARVQVPSPLSRRCAGCEAEALTPLDPEGDPRFRARCAYYRRLTERALQDPELAPHPFFAAEHSAAIGQALEGELHARTEEYELRFQDVPIPAEGGRVQGPVDVLSCTTTMEVGVDIGSLTGVALRNVPPGRANYQQRAGRAGRRGSALATVITYAGADGHDQRFFHEPGAMVGGPVRDPVIRIDNPEIVRRQAFALMLSLFQREAIRDDDPAQANLFMSLGTLRDFRLGAAPFSFAGLKTWLARDRDEVLAALEELVPDALPDRDAEIEDLPALLLDRLGRAGAGPLSAEARAEHEGPGARAAEAEARSARVGAVIARDEDLDDLGGPAPAPSPDDAPVQGADQDQDAALDPELLLDRLFSQAVLPRYAFPTDVVSLYIFDTEGSSRFQRPRFRYSPQQGLTAALAQYAPGKDVWVDGLKWHPMAIWSPFRRDTQQAWLRHRLYLECGRCHFAKTVERGGDIAVRQAVDCRACGARGGMRPAMRWLTPAGFAHPVDLAAELPGASDPPLTRPTRAKLSADLDAKGAPPLWTQEGVTVWEAREELIVTNTGAESAGDRRGFLYCLKCGRAEPNGWPDGKLRGGQAHPRPAPARRGESETCDGGFAEVALGCSFRTDLCLIRLRLQGGARLLPGSPVAQIALTSVAEAVAAAARAALDLDAGEVAAEQRPAQTLLGPSGEEAEVYLYDAVPGGAGYAAAAARLQDPNLLARALELLEGCREGCERSCYACLRSYQNRWMHGLLDRKLGADLLRHCLHGTPLRVSADRAAPCLDAMAAYLSEEGHAAERADDHLRVNGAVVRLCHPLTPEEGPPGERWVSLLRAQRALPDACKLARGEPLAARDDDAPPRPPLREDPSGMPAFRCAALVAGLESAPPLGRYAVDGANPGSFLIYIENHNLERLEIDAVRARQGTWALCEVAETPEALEQTLAGGAAALVVWSGGNFHGTGAPWTLAKVSRQPGGEGEPRLTIRYSTTRASGQAESIPLAQARFVGFLARLIA